MMSQGLRDTFKRMFEPESVAFIGATDTPGKWGFTILHHILQGGYGGNLHLVNPGRDTVFGQPCNRNIADIEETPDLAILVVPASRILGAMDDVIAKGTRSAVVITSGFAEAGEEGRILQDRINAKAEENGLRFVGPNSMGIITSYPHRLVSTMGSAMPGPGSVAVVAQSGNLGVTYMSRMMRRNIGVSRSISTGNMANLTFADYVEMLAEDDKTDIICLYLEGVPEGRRFLDVVEETTRKKPVIALKGGRGEKGSKAAQSHTAAVSGSHDLFCQSLEEVGVILTDTIDETINIVGGFHTNPLPKGNRAGILTLGGGWGVLGTDACERFGIDLPDLPPEVMKDLNALLPDYWSKGNPVDTVATTNVREVTPKVLEALFNAECFDSVIYLGVAYMAYQGRRYKEKGPGYTEIFDQIGDILVASENQMVDRIIEMKEETNKPLFLVADLVARDEVFDENVVHKLEGKGIFVHNSPWEAAHAAGAMVKRLRYLERCEKRVADLHIEKEEDAIARANRAIEIACKRPHGQLSEHESKLLLKAVGIDIAKEKESDNIDGVVTSANEIGYPVALKLSNPDIIHKSEAGGVALNIKNDDEAREHAKFMLKHGNCLVQKMAMPSSVELLVGLKYDESFGPALVFGKGGIETEVWADTASLSAPVRPDQAKRMIERTKVSRLLGEFRGRAALDLDALVEVLVRISRLPELFPMIKELDINPLFLYEKGYAVVDAAIVVETN